MKKNSSSQRIALAALTLVVLAHLQLLPHHSHAQQQQPQQPRGERHGRVAHERPSCQSAFAASQRRRLATDTPTLLTLINDNNSQAPHNVSTDLSNLRQSGDSTTSEQQQAPTATASAAKPRLNTSERLFQLRQLLKSNNYDAYLMTPNDEHGSEYVAEYDRRLRFMTGFTGSNGFALIMLDRAVLFTDGRYALQAEAELDCNWGLVVSNEPLDDIHTWLAGHVREMRGLRVALDARLMPLQEFDYLDERLKKLDASFEFALISLDLVDIVWANLRGEAPREPPSGPLEVQPLEFAGQVSWQEKVLRLVDRMQVLKARHYVISKLDDIAWLLNLRGSDIPMAPLFKAYLLVSRYPAAAAPSPLHPPVNVPQPVNVAPSDQTNLLATQPPPPAMYQASSDLLTLQAPQVLQVPTSQVVKLTFYVDLRKITQQVRDHLRLENATSLSGEHHTASQELNGGSTTSGLATGSRIRVELRDYDVFYMDLRARFSSSSLQSTPLPLSNSQTISLLTTTSGSGASPTTGNLGGSLPATGSQSQQQASNGKLLLDAMANVAIHVLAKNYDEGSRLILIEPLLQQLKSVKSELEVEGMRQAHWRDSLAIAMLLGQLEYDVGVRKRTEKWTEVSAARELEFFRSLMEHNRGQSFDTISAYGANAAIVHYKPNSEAPPSEQFLIGNQSTYLLDSGGQYLDGTTDITRTVHFGAPTEFQRETYTRVLMGAIDMMSLIFEQLPAGSPKAAYRLNDLLARRHLFDLGLDYEHGTGHGIGAYSMVHENPPLIEHFARTCSSANVQVGGNSKMTTSGAGGQQQQMVVNEPQPMRENMFTSVEPGFYRAGEFGIRLENIVVTQRVQLRNDTTTTGKARGAQRDWLRFEPISLVPFEPKLMKLELMSNKQKAWLNSYNLMVRLRMTQQINHYLAKLRTSRQAGSSASQTSGSSRLYRFLSSQHSAAAAASNGSVAAVPAADLRIEPLKFQQLLEQAHRWIMAKTELIALDVPQRLQARAALVVGAEQQQVVQATQSGGVASAASDPLVATTSQQRQQHQQLGKQSNRKRQGDDQWSSLGADPEGQRLMLAYMSSLPFNDADAARAVATLASRAASQSGVELVNSTSAISNKTTNGNKDSPFPAPLSQKCVGIECDLLLLEALNSHQQQQQHSNKRHLKPASGFSSAAAAVDAHNSYDANGDGDGANTLLAGAEVGGGPSQMLMDLFQISTSGARQSDWWSLASMWPILGLAVILVLQLAVMAYVCSGGSSSSASARRKQYTGGALSRALSSSSSRRTRPLASTTEQLVGMTQVQQQQQQPQPPHQMQPIIVTENV